MTRKTMWRTAVAGGAAAVFTGLAAVPAGAAEGGVSFTRVKVNNGQPIVIGVKEEVEVRAYVRMTTKLKYDSGPKVFPYRGSSTRVTNSGIPSSPATAGSSTGRRGSATSRSG